MQLHSKDCVSKLPQRLQIMECEADCWSVGSENRHLQIRIVYYMNAITYIKPVQKNSNIQIIRTF